MKMSFSDDGMSSSELLQAHSHLWNCSLNYIKSMSLKCAIDLGIPDIVHNHGQPITFSKFMASLPLIHPSKTHCVYRIMRINVHSGFFAAQMADQSQLQHEQEHQESAYSLTNTTRLLLSEAPAFMKMKPLFLFHLLPEAMAPWHTLSTWLKNGDISAFETAKGRTFWDCLADEPSLNHIFNKAMASDSQLIAKVTLEEYKEVFEGLTSLVDVGGGTGTMAKAVANKFPNVTCTVFDLPHVVSDLQGSSDADLITFIGGNVFSDPIPPADAILLKLFLHDWDDKDCVTILKRCKEAVLRNGDKGGKVIVMDMVLDNQKIDEEVSGIQLCNDVLMMAVSGKERTLTEWEKLFLAAGFTSYNITPILGSARSLIEVYP